MFYHKNQCQIYVCPELLNPRIPELGDKFYSTFPSGIMSFYDFFFFRIVSISNGFLMKIIASATISSPQPWWNSREINFSCFELQLHLKANVFPHKDHDGRKNEEQN